NPDGEAWSERKRYLWWDATQGRWTGEDVADFKATMPPDYEPPENARAEDALRGRDPFVMQADGRAWLFAPDGLKDSPLPTHYEPHESPVSNPLYGQQSNQVRQIFHRRYNEYNQEPDKPDSGVFPYVVPTYRLTEHHTAGGMTRFIDYLNELQPEMFCEVSPR